jgi:hypothetical protein
MERLTHDKSAGGGGRKVNNSVEVQGCSKKIQHTNLKDHFSLILWHIVRPNITHFNERL